MLRLRPPPNQAHHLEPLPHLLPRAMWVPGWQHSCDGALKDSLQKLPWFAAFLKQLKAVISWLRCDSYREALRKAALAQDQDGSVFDRVPPGFAHWRWGTLQSVAQYLLTRSALLRLV